MYETLKATLTGVSPLLMHNGRLADPMDEIAKLMKGATKQKTDEGRALLSKLEWLGSLYVTEPIGIEVKGTNVAVSGDGKLCLPGDNIEAMLVESAKKVKRGNAFKAAVFVPEDAVVEFSGPKSISDLLSRAGFRDVRGVRVGKARVMRTRCMIREWHVSLEIRYLPLQVNRDEITDALARGGEIIGLGDFRPKYGRFSVSVS